MDNTGGNTGASQAPPAAISLRSATCPPPQFGSYFFHEVCSSSVYFWPASSSIGQSLYFALSSKRDIPLEAASPPAYCCAAIIADLTNVARNRTADRRSADCSRRLERGGCQSSQFGWLSVVPTRQPPRRRISGWSRASYLTIEKALVGALSGEGARRDSLQIV